MSAATITRADGFGNWHAKVSTESEAFTAIWHELEQRDDATADYALVLERCKVDAGCWAEVAE